MPFLATRARARASARWIYVGVIALCAGAAGILLHHPASADKPAPAIRAALAPAAATAQGGAVEWSRLPEEPDPGPAAVAAY